ncbi:general stress protein [Corynebacterium mayonis]|uniref:general stress protein n=1 Tax=Corynebacterium mayonis TaxID=3062461 RepID=UPI003CC80B84
MAFQPRPNDLGMNPTNARQRPSGWPVGRFDTYADAQRAVDSLADSDFPVQHLTIVGVDLMQVENVTGRGSEPRKVDTEF